MPRPIIFDCDPGNDDAVALLITLISPEDFTVLGITTVAGNVPLENTNINARKICELANRTDVGVYSGCPRPLVGEPFISDGAHGKTGIDGAVLPDPKMPLQPQHAVDFIIETVKNHQEPVTMLLTGPLTNLAIAINKDPSILSNIKECVIMGGSISAGNITPAAEFNVFCDAYATKVVLEAGVKTTLMTLDITHQVLATPDNIRRLRAVGTEQADQVANMLEATQDFDVSNFGLAGRAIHDACVPVYILQPELFNSRKAFVHVITTLGDSFGNTIISYYPKHVKPTSHVFVPDQIQGDLVFDVILERLGRYPKTNQARVSNNG